VHRVLVRRVRRARTLLVAIAAAIGATLAACTAVTTGHGAPASLTTTGTASPSTGRVSSTPSAPAPARITFTDCSSLFNLSAVGIPADRLTRLQFGCGKVAVPLDYAHPNGQMISVAVIRIHDTEQTKRVGSLLVNPGGPGASGIFLAISLARDVSNDVLDHFDVVGFDPRGVGLSSPVRCTTNAQEDALLALDVDMRTANGRAAAEQANRAFADACDARYGATLEHFNTAESARDMDQIRRAVGDSKLNYLGFSYGTELGAVYAHLFPTSIRAMVLDGAVDPATLGDVVKATDEQVSGFEQAFDQFAADCATRLDCRQLGNARAAVLALKRRADQQPIASSVPGETRKANGAVVLYAALSALYSSDQWPDLGTALLDAQRGDAKGLFALLDDYSERSGGQFTNLLDVYQVVTCNDTPGDPTDAQVAAAAASWAGKYRLFGLWAAESLVQCDGWQSDRHAVPEGSASGSPPILVVGNVHDPATPYQGTLHLASELGTGVVLTWDGQGHTSYGSSSCIAQKVNNYLINLTVPAAKTTCPP
jgi:pimeloyl-ACP methyl ester carboxylesterase